MKWIFLAASLASMFLVYDQLHQYVLFTSFGIAFGNFAAFCLQYEVPAQRAQQRVDERLQLGGLSADAQASLRSSKPPITAEDRAFRWDTLTMINVATGIAALGICAWGIMARMGMA